ncbi:MAG TPA: GntR family transcriptional regulator, partial [Candidatus Polarisedimenticolaceae bacterium]|nr:GntR family transcriptional regulator [Candidatus Polarisedimenticolaceae bacterium]
MIPDLDPKSPVPLYLQIVEQVRRLLALGVLKPGERFLTVRELGARARVNRNTAARAIGEMERSGMVRTRVGQGTFIADAPPAMEAGRREAALDSAIEKLLVEAHALGVHPEELGWRLHRKLEQFARTRR